MNQGSSTIIQIGNPTMKITFNDLFGQNGPTIDSYGPKERLISFLQETFPEDNINFIEYMESFLPYFQMCKCYDDKGKIIFCVAFQIYTVISFQVISLTLIIFTSTHLK